MGDGSSVVANLMDTATLLGKAKVEDTTSRRFDTDTRNYKHKWRCRTLEFFQVSLFQNKQNRTSGGRPLQSVKAVSGILQPQVVVKLFTGGCSASLTVQIDAIPKTNPRRLESKWR